MTSPKIVKALGRFPDFIIGDTDNPYLLRWFLIPKNRFFNIYLHKFCRSDDDRALHDHPWSWNISILLRGHYIEHMAGGKSKVRRPGLKGLIFRWGTTPHRVELYFEYELGPVKPTHTLPGLPIHITGEAPVWTIFITGPKVREWGFHCPQGWRHWRDYVSLRDGGNSVGRGCED